MPLHTLTTLNHHLAAARDHLNCILVPDALLQIMVSIHTFIKNPAQVRPLGSAIVPAPERPHGTPPAGFRMNEDISLVEVTPALLALIEVARSDELLGDRWERFLDPEERQRIWEQWMVAAQMKTGFTHLLRYTSPKGTRLLLRVRVYPLHDTATKTFHGWFGDVEAISKGKVLKIDALDRPDTQQTA